MRGAVVVTGASTGIGAATARRLVSVGFDVFGTVRRTADAGPLESAGVTPLVLDVTDPAAIARAVADVTARVDGRGLAGLVNNAGVAAAGPLELVSPDEVRRALDVNVVGVIAVTQAFLPLLTRARGRVVNVSSVSGRMALPFMGAYAATKFALEAVSDAWRRELLPAGVDVIVVQPGSIRTPIWGKAEAAFDLSRAAGTPYERAIERVRQWMRRGADQGLPPDDVARAISTALTSRRPPTRILVVPGSRLKRRLMFLLPDRWVDRMVARRLWR